MNYSVKEAAQLLGIREGALRAWLREKGHLNKDGSLAAKHVGGTLLHTDARVTQPKQLGHRKHYAVVKVTPAGIDWLAKQLGIVIKEVPQKDSAA